MHPPFFPNPTPFGRASRDPTTAVAPPPLCDPPMFHPPDPALSPPLSRLLENVAGHAESILEGLPGGGGGGGKCGKKNVER